MSEAAKKDDIVLDPKKCMGRYPHYWHWIWKHEVMTSEQKCNTCGEVRDTKEMDKS